MVLMWVNILNRPMDGIGFKAAILFLPIRWSHDMLVLFGGGFARGVWWCQKSI